MSTYVCSDLHGQLNKFEKMIKGIDLKEDDTLYILGDVIDRGKDPIPLMLKIMDMDNVVCLLGNHEWMMYNYIMFNMDFHVWIKNGGMVTCNQFRNLPETYQNIIMEYIMSMQVVIPDLQINEKHFYLSHASYIDEDIPFKNNIITLKNKPEYIDQAVWKRMYPVKNIQSAKMYEKYKGYTLIVGHTPTGSITHSNKPQRIFYSNKKHYIDIDCGCAYIPIKNTGRLGCLRLEDFKEFYF